MLVPSKQKIMEKAKKAISKRILPVFRSQFDTNVYSYTEGYHQAINDLNSK